MSGHILVVGQIDHTRRALVELLKRAEMPVQVSSTVPQALADIHHRPSLVVLDLATAGGDCLDVMKAVRAMDEPIKIAVISCGFETRSLGWITAYRPDAIFGKPFDFADFVDWLEHSDLCADLNLAAATDEVAFQMAA
jgi:DNA-binding NtrC family response regulator